MPPAALQDRETLIAQLRKRGIDYLAPSDAVSEVDLDDSTLLASLASQDDPRVRQALVALFLVHPGLSRWVPLLRTTLDPGARLNLEAYFLAAIYLQEMWWYRISRYLPHTERLPDDLCHELSLPGRKELHGKMGLHALADWHSSQSARRANRLSEYQGAAELVLESLKLKRRRNELETKRR